MGLRDYFKGVRKKDQGQTRLNKGDTRPATTVNTQNSVSTSQPTTQTASNTILSAKPRYVKRDLWDEAYEALQAQNQDLIQKYEEIILEYDKQNADATTQQLGESLTTKFYHDVR